MFLWIADNIELRLNSFGSTLESQDASANTSTSNPTNEDQITKHKERSSCDGDDDLEKITQTNNVQQTDASSCFLLRISTKQKKIIYAQPSSSDDDDHCDDDDDYDSRPRNFDN